MWELFLIMIGSLMLALMPIANGISWIRSMRRTEERRRQRRIAQGLSSEPSDHRRWKNYTRGTAWDRRTRR